MPNLNRHMPPIRTSQFSHVPRNDVPRSTFATDHAHITTLSANYLVPFFIDEVFPGDVHKIDGALFARIATPTFPLMDDPIYRITFFFCPFRILWDHWENFMGANYPNTNSTTDYLIPQTVSPPGGWPTGSLQDFMGLPVYGTLGSLASTVSVNVLYQRAYNKIYNDWWRDENMQNAVPENTGDGPDAESDYVLLKANKRHDYFNAALPFAQKGSPVPLPIAGYAPVEGIAIAAGTTQPAGAPGAGTGIGGSNWAYTRALGTSGPGQPPASGPLPTDWPNYMDPWTDDSTGAIVFRMSESGPAIYANLTGIPGATINAMRLAVTMQQWQEINARGGTRYTEVIQSHFGVLPEDFRLQRPEYIGGGRGRVKIEAVASTAETEDAPLGDLGAAGVAANSWSASYAAAEHGCIIGLINFSHVNKYQQGLHRRYTRRTKYDFPWPVFADIGEQAIRNDEIFVRGSAAGTGDEGTFGYIPRYDELRHYPSMVTGMFRSNITGSLDKWHLAIDFASLPVLNSGYIVDAAPYERVLRAGELANNQQLLCDFRFHMKRTRAIPMVGKPGLRRF